MACLGGVDLGGASVVGHVVGRGAVAHVRGIPAGSGTDAKLGGQVAHRRQALCVVRSAPFPRLGPTGSRSNDQRLLITPLSSRRRRSPRCEEFRLIPAGFREPNVGSRRGIRRLGVIALSLDLNGSDHCLLWSRGVHSHENPLSRFDRDFKGFTSVCLSNCLAGSRSPGNDHFFSLRLLCYEPYEHPQLPYGNFFRIVH